MAKDKDTLPVPRTIAAFDILANTNSAVNSLLDGIKASEAGHLEVRRLFDRIRDDIRDADKRARNETIRVGLLGGRGSGKSTLANALMGEELLPESAIVFCTSLPVTIKYSSASSLELKSEFSEYEFSQYNISVADMRRHLNSVCKESENPENQKKVSEITIGLPQEILDGKEIVDVPGFTRGNPLHQAFAEQYARHYCDVCLVLLNNSESIEINSRQGLDALAGVFADRVDSAIFLVNKCDDSSERDIQYIKSAFGKRVAPAEPQILEISAKNSLKREGGQFGFQKLLGSLSFLSNRRSLVLVRALLGRLVSNFTSFKDLCHLTAAELSEIQVGIFQLLEQGFDQFRSDFEESLKEERFSVREIPEVDLSYFDLPPNPLGLGPYEYKALLITSIQNGSQVAKLSELVQHQQAHIYRSFSRRFEAGIAGIIQKLQGRVAEFEAKFGITSAIETPRIENSIQVRQFDPAKIERLRPLSVRLWLEKKIPGVFSRDVEFWKAPVSIGVGGFSFNFGIPVGVKRKNAMVYEIQERVPKEAMIIMNEYVYNALDEFVGELYNAHLGAINQFAKDWKNQLADYAGRVKAAQAFASEKTVAQIDTFIEELRQFHGRVSLMMKES